MPTREGHTPTRTLIETLRDVRHKGLCEGETNVTKNQVDEALQEANDLIARLRERLNDGET